MTPVYVSDQELDAALDQVLASPSDGGRVALIVVRPAQDKRETRREVHLSPEGGLDGDRWGMGGEPPDQQVSLMNARLLRLLAGGDEERMAQAGDNLVVDLALDDESLPAGQRLRIGDVLLEITGAPHTGCGSFAARFGRDAARYVNAAQRRGLHLRGRYARVLRAGTVCVGDEIVKVSTMESDSTM